MTAPKEWREYMDSIPTSCHYGFENQTQAELTILEEVKNIMDTKETSVVVAHNKVNILCNHCVKYMTQDLMDKIKYIIDWKSVYYQHW